MLMNKFKPIGNIPKNAPHIPDSELFRGLFFIEILLQLSAQTKVPCNVALQVQITQLHVKKIIRRVFEHPVSQNRDDIFVITVAQFLKRTDFIQNRLI